MIAITQGMAKLCLKSRYLSSNSPSDEPLYSAPTPPHPPTLARWDPLTPHPLTNTNNSTFSETPPVTK
jgi:hypothetical protein